MYKSFFIITIVSSIFFSGCSIVSSGGEVVKSNVKVFEQEDSLILFALRAEETRNYELASKLFKELYEKSEKKEYLYRSLQNKLYQKRYKEIVACVDEICEDGFKDYELIRFKVLALVQQHKIHEAKELAIALLKQSREVKDYMMVSEILIELKEYNLAVKYLESAYQENYDEKILDRMSIILYVNLKRKKDAIAYLDTHTRVHGCSELICKRLIAIYSNENNLDGLLSIYLKFYQIKPSKEIAKQIVQLYAYKKQYNKIILFLEESKSDDEVLLELYRAAKNYKKAYPLAQKLYDKTGDVRYFGESVIYEYETNIDKIDEAFLNKISKKFERVLDLDDSSYLLNYYGYILIDHDLDVQKGINYVNQALEKEPESVYFLDSLAWGYYKVGKCKKSKELIKKVMSLEGGDDPEVLKHYKKIKNCKGK